MPEPILGPCRDDAQLRAYIDEHWRQGHVLARDPAMFDFQYRTPWVDHAQFSSGTSALCLYHDDGRLAGFLGAIVAPYPRPQSFWLALWHVLPETKGTGLGGQLLQAMQDMAAHAGGWIGTFGAGSEALPVYLKRGYGVRAVRRWLFEPEADLSERAPAPLTSTEVEPPREWLDYRYGQHPRFSYERSASVVLRTERNDWGLVTHVLHLSPGWQSELRRAHEAGHAQAASAGVPFLMDCWAFDAPGGGWVAAAADVPSVFHPPEARGSIIYASGRPFLPAGIDKGDCDQDRPN